MVKNCLIALNFYLWWDIDGNFWGSGLQPLIETAKANNLEPYAYILHILNHIGAADTLGEIEALLPWNVPQGIAQK